MSGSHPVVGMSAEAIAHTDQLRARLAEAVATDDVREAKAVVGAADTLRDVCRRTKASEADQRAYAALSLEAQAAAGRILRESPIGKGRKCTTLGHLDIDRHESQRWQSVGDVPDDTLAAYVAKPDEELTRAGLLAYHRRIESGITDDEADDWYTPAWLFDQLGLTFDIDVCAPLNPAHRTCPAKLYLTEADDGLQTHWHGLIWCNPPYSDPAPWSRRWAEHPEGLLLTHISPKARRMVESWRAADAMILFSGMFFNRPNGETHTPYWSIQLLARGRGAVDALRGVQGDWASPVFRAVRHG